MCLLGMVLCFWPATRRTDQRSLSRRLRSWGAQRNSVFHHSHTTTRRPHSAHAVDLLSNGPVSLCNVLFVDSCCHHSEREVSCTVRLADSSEFVLDSVMFQGADSSEGKHVVFQKVGSSSLLTTRITNCDSTTGTGNCLIVDEDRLDSTLIPRLLI
ncbi:hypothetical protein BLNAU_10558 [Blattamonas nauphoetae]|uniref:Uncharacterized protein n=1 Tax=Blattamonas nauphoetae TaxID=2049346 RepID=A0ABQ9XQ52_9EUKA|nr:hypothetical protein BLNAU_10558 [Blattamonas nauphoetae]